VESQKSNDQDKGKISYIFHEFLALSAQFLFHTQVFNGLLQLYVNGVVIDSAEFRIGAANDQFQHKFITNGLKVTATQIIKITMTHDVVAATSTTKTSGTLVLFEEDAGASPAV